MSQTQIEPILSSLQGSLPGHITSDLMNALGPSSAFHFEWLKQDGSSRRYLRIKDTYNAKSFVVMILADTDTQKLTSNSYEWITIGHLLSEKGINCPKVIATLPASGAIVLEDLGSTHACDFLSDRSPDQIEQTFEDCFRIIEKFLDIDPYPLDSWSHRSFTSQQFTQELFFFEEHILKQDDSHWLSDKQRSIFEAEVLSLSAFLANQSHYFVHRDFHSKNIMMQNEGMWILDFQDARLGPPSYDLVSLCFDSYLKLSNPLRCQLMLKGLSGAMNHVDAAHRGHLEDSWQAMLLQRQLKAIGSFGFLTKTKGQNYLLNAPRALASLRETLELYPLPLWPFLSKDLLGILAEKRIFH